MAFLRSDLNREIWLRVLRLVRPAVLALLIALAACSPTPTPTAPTPRPTPAVPAGGDAEAAADLESVDFALEVYQGPGFEPGSEIRIAELLARGKPLILNFWAGQCPPCREELPDFQRAHETYGDDVTFVGADVGALTGLGTEADAQLLMAQLGVTYLMGRTDEFGVMIAYGAVGVPTTVSITPQGKIVRRWTGILDEARLEAMIEELLAASG